MPAKDPGEYVGIPRPRRREFSDEPNMKALEMALLQQGKLGQVPSNLAINEYIASIPMGREARREQMVLDDMDARSQAAFDAFTTRQNFLDDLRANATARDFETRRDPTEELGPPDPQVRSIRRFGTSSVATDPDAAASAGEKAMRDPRVLSAGIANQGRLDAAAIAADARVKAVEAKAQADKEKAAAGEPEAKATRDEIIRLANELKESPYLAANVGVFDASGWNPIPTVRGGSKDFQKKAQRLRDLLALEARSKLKGQGAVSDFEGRMLANSQTSLDRQLDEGSFVSELDRIIGEQERKGKAAPTGVKRYNPATGRVE